MTTLRIEPGSLTGTLRVPSSKSMGHRALICAALAGGTSQVEGVSLSQDILATCACLRQLGAKITSQEETGGRAHFTVEGCRPHQTGTVLDCPYCPGRHTGRPLQFCFGLAVGAALRGRPCPQAEKGSYAGGLASPRNNPMPPRRICSLSHGAIAPPSAQRRFFLQHRPAGNVYPAHKRSQNRLRSGHNRSISVGQTF